MKKTMLAFGLVALLALSSTPAHADSAIDFTGFGISGSGSFVVGWSFSTNAPLLVTDLGYYDFGGDGLGSGHEVGIFDFATGTLLGETIVSNASTEYDGFFYQHIFGGPLALAANQRYIIAAINREHPTATSDPYVGNVTGFTTIPEINFGRGMFDPFPGGAFLAPTQFDALSPSIFGPNFRTIPEPGAVALFGLGSLAIAYRRRRRKASRA